MPATDQGTAGPGTERRLTTETKRTRQVTRGKLPEPEMTFPWPSMRSPSTGETFRTSLTTIVSKRKKGKSMGKSNATIR